MFNFWRQKGFHHKTAKQACKLLTDICFLMYKICINKSHKISNSSFLFPANLYRIYVKMLKLNYRHFLETGLVVTVDDAMELNRDPLTNPRRWCCILEMRRLLRFLSIAVLCESLQEFEQNLLGDLTPSSL